MPDKLIVYEAADGWRWHRVAANGRIVSESGEAYEEKGGAEVAAAREAEGSDAIIAVVDDVEIVDELHRHGEVKEEP